ncbi:MAG: response regulator [Pseudomonadota bacterium]
MFNKQTALIIDRDSISSKTIMRVLKDDLDFDRVIIVSDGKEAQAELKIRRIDWIFGEWEMSDMQGIDLLKKLRSHPDTMEVPFIMLSSRIDRSSLFDAIAQGVTDFIAKPFTPATISEKVQRIVRIKEKRIAPRITPHKKYPAEFSLSSVVKLEGIVSNISVTGILISAPRLQQATLNIFDVGPLNVAIDDGIVIQTQGRLIRMECDYDPAHEPETHILCAFDFKVITDDNRIILNKFINEQRRLAMST